jgi:hypothetical protein
LAELVHPPFQNLQPLSGWRDDNSCAVELQVAWAGSFGLSFIVFDWYYKAQTLVPSQNLNSAIEIMRALPDRHGMRFAILYIGSDPFTIPSADWASAFEGRSSYMRDPACLSAL